jgi:serine/threonine-protein kinase
MSDEFIGKTIGGYEILEPIGRGGMATVFRALQTSMNRTVALKVLPRDMMKDDTYLQRFEREVSIVATLEHRNIVPVYDHGSYEGQPYIAMRYMKGGPLDNLIGEKGMTLDQMVRIFEQIAPALDYAHSKNILHRDLKPSNILLDDDGGAYITDFGIARILNETSGMTITTQGVVGTPAYMSPEQAQGHPMDGRSDVYALGIMLFEMATGRRPFHSDTPYSIAVMQVTAPVPSPRGINPSLPLVVEQVILKALKKKPEERYQTAQDLAEAFKMAVERPGLSIHDTQPNAINVRAALERTQQGTVPPLVSPQPAPVPVNVPPPSPMPMQPTPMPVYQPMSPRTPGSAAVSSVVPPARRRPQRKPRSRGMWMSMAIGAFIGCALLAVVVVVLIFVVDMLIGGLGGASVPSSSLPTTAPNAAAPQLPAIFTTQTAVAVSIRSLTGTPEPAEPTASGGEIHTLTSGSVLYFAERADSEGRRRFNIFRRDLSMEGELQLTADGSNNSYPSPSPDGQAFAFQSDQVGNYDIYRVNSAGGERVRLTGESYNEVLPAWSSDGAWIAYAADVRGDGTYDLMRISADGNVVETLVSNGLRNTAPRWDSTGQRLVFVSGDPRDASTWDVVLLELDGMDLRKLTEDDTRDAWPVFSPDDRYVLYVSGNEGSTAIRRVPVAGGASEEVHTAGDFIWSLDFTPDGTQIIFNAGAPDEANGTPYAVPAAGGDRQPLGVSSGIGVTWLP